MINNCNSVIDYCEISAEEAGKHNVSYIVHAINFKSTFVRKWTNKVIPNAT